MSIKNWFTQMKEYFTTEEPEPSNTGAFFPNDPTPFIAQPFWWTETAAPYLWDTEQLVWLVAYKNGHVWSAVNPTIED